MEDLITTVTPGVVEASDRFLQCNCLGRRLLKRLPGSSSWPYQLSVQALLSVPSAGCQLIPPWAGIPQKYWKTEVRRRYNIPTGVKTFCYSPLVTAIIPNVRFKGDTFEHAYWSGGMSDLLRDYPAERVPAVEGAAYRSLLVQLEEHVHKLWGDPLCILVFFDAVRAPAEARARLYRAQYDAAMALNWPIVRADSEPHLTDVNWTRGSDECYDRMAEDVLRLEQTGETK